MTTNESPRVSVIVPAYNATEYIGEALESVQRQTVSDWEVVVCDDGSSDDTAAVASGFGERVRVIRSPVNQGLAAARNLAIGHSRGALLALLDSDDVWLPNYLERQLQRLDECPRPEKVGIVTCNAYLRNAQGRLPGTYADRYGYADHVGIERLLDISPIFISAVLPRAAIEQVGLFSADMRSCEDLDLWFRLVEAGYEVISTREPLVVYRLSAGQLSAQPVKVARGRQVVYRRAIARGRLTPSQRNTAERAIRRERAIEAIASGAADLRERRLPRTRPSELALIARVLAENPSRWRRWMRLARNGNVWSLTGAHAETASR
jgi:glycosyltransferase involved in cell wall biosynthesis